MIKEVQIYETNQKKIRKVMGETEENAIDKNI